MASKAISDFLTMPEDMQLVMTLVAQNGDITVEGFNPDLEKQAEDYWSGRKGSGSGITSVFPFRRTDPSGNLYIIHRDVCLYLNLLFTGVNIDYLYNYKITGVDGEFSQEMKDQVREAVVLGETTVELSGALKCEALSKSFRGYEDLTPVVGIEVSATNPFEGSAVFHISKRTSDRISREDKEIVRELDALSKGTRSSRQRGIPAFVS
jgi:hypothetical protein